MRISETHYDDWKKLIADIKRDEKIIRRLSIGLVMVAIGIAALLSYFFFVKFK